RRTWSGYVPPWSSSCASLGRLRDRVLVGRRVAGLVGLVPGPLGRDDAVRRGVDVLEGRDGRSAVEGADAGPEADAQLVGGLLHLGDVVVVELLLRPQEGSEPVDRVAAPPHLLLVGGAVARRVVRRRVGAHAVREGLDEARALAPACPLHGLL